MKILIVEDESGIQRFLRQGLEEEGFVVSVSSGGSEALKLALGQEYDIVLLDWMLPGTSGLEICRQMRRAGKLTPVIFLTARDTVDDVVNGLKSGANDYIRKPFHFEELLERIKVQLRPVTADNKTLSLGDIRMELSTHRVFRNEHEIQLTQKEFALLEYLIRHKEHVCKRSSIIQHVWDIHFEYSSSVLDVFINSLRKKLGLARNDDYIHTIRGIGFIAREK